MNGAHAAVDQPQAKRTILCQIVEMPRDRLMTEPGCQQPPAAMGPFQPFLADRLEPLAAPERAAALETVAQSGKEFCG